MDNTNLPPNSNQEILLHSTISTGSADGATLNFSLMGTPLGDDIEYTITLPYNFMTNHMVWQCPCRRNNEIWRRFCTACYSSRPLFARIQELPVTTEALVTNLRSIQFYRNEPFEDVKITLNETQFTNAVKRRNMGDTLINELEVKDKTCCICMDEIKDRQRTGITKCKHIFHHSCIREWLTKKCSKPTCPNCRQDLRE